MLQTVQAKPDAAAPVKPAAMENPAGGPNTFYSKFMAAMPQGDANALKAENAQAAGKEPRQSPVPDRGAQDRLRTEPAVPRGERIRPDRPADGSAARVPSAPPGAKPAEASKPEASAAQNPSASTAPGTPAATQAAAAAGSASAADPDHPDAIPADPSAPVDPSAVATQEARDAAAAAAAAAAAVAWLATQGLQAPDPGTAQTQAQIQAQPQAGDGSAAGPQGAKGAQPPTPGTDQAAAQAAAPAKPGGPQVIAAAQAQAALEQIPGGGKVQFQFGDQPTQTTKPALSEFMNQLKPQIQGPTFAGVGSASAETPAVAPGAHAGQELNMPVPAAQTALLTGAQPAKELGPEPAASPAHPAPVDAIGAMAAPGAATAARVTPTAAPEPAQLRHENPMAQVDSTVKWLIKNKEQSAELQLHPENLGRVQIKLSVDGHEVHAKLWASEASALPVLQDHRAFLEASLKAQGLTLGSFDLQHGQQSNQTPLPRPEHALPPPTLKSAPAIIGQETPGTLTQGPAGSHRISIVA